MRALTVQEAQTQLGQLIGEVCSGELIVVTDGNKQVALEPRAAQGESENPELEAELLKAANGPFTPYSPAEMREAGQRVIREKRGCAFRLRNPRCSRRTLRAGLLITWVRRARRWRGGSWPPLN
jgi:antitoxin (DNA-binding transcriptional repressor) of toxin-antitoxin stability system